MGGATGKTATVPGDKSLTPDELAQLRILRGASIEAVWGLLEHCPVRHLVPGELLLAKGKENRTLYMLLAGELSVHLDNPLEPPVARLPPGVSVGEISVIDASPASAFVVAATPCRLLVVNQETFWRMVRASHEFSTNMLLLLAERMRATNSSAAATERDKKRFETASLVDALTNLKNRRWLDDALPRIIERELADQRPISIAMLDIDFFKRFNDAHGHAAGDLVLREVAALILQRLRPLDVGARYGGEEILLIFPGTAAPGAEVAAERLRRIIAEMEIVTANGENLPRVTVSMGVAEALPGETVAELIGRADAALYEAKHAGRNRVVRAG